MKANTSKNSSNSVFHNEVSQSSCNVCVKKNRCWRHLSSANKLRQGILRPLCPSCLFFSGFFQMKKSRKTAAFQRLLFRFLVKIQVTPAGFKGSLRSTSAEAEIFSALTRCATPDPSRWTTLSPSSQQQDGRGRPRRMRTLIAPSRLPPPPIPRRRHRGDPCKEHGYSHRPQHSAHVTSFS